MIFKETKLAGAFLIELEKFEDDRGFFARSWSASEFAERGLESRLAECNISFNKKNGTLRGMHYQAAPYGQAKVVRCTMGSIYDVIIDLRTESPTFKQWVGVELSAANRRMLYIPKDFAHGFQTLEDATEVFYQMSDSYVPENGRGVRWNDPAFGIVWPELDEITIADRDRNYPDFAQPSKGTAAPRATPR
jgi:dTDP-4-dehydrorhamnose 3,5-epimerase